MIDSIALSFVGRREGNEDACVALSLGNDTFFFAVADGMGGTKGGEVASNLVLSSARSFLKDAIACELPPEKFKETLASLFAVAQQAVRAQKTAQPDLVGMGSTLACVLLKGNKFVAGHIGDSRIYLLREGVLSQISEDHTYLQQMIRETGSRPDAGFVQNYGHYITKSIEGGSDQPDLYPADAPWAEMRDGEALLLCSDGLITDKSGASSEALKMFLVGTRSLREAAEQLISDAFHAGSSDNISVVLAVQGKLKREQIKLPKHSYPPVERPKQQLGSGRIRQLHWTQRQITLYLTMLLIAVVLGALYFLGVFDSPLKRVESLFEGEKPAVTRKDPDKKGGARGESATAATLRSRDKARQALMDSSWNLFDGSEIPYSIQHNTLVWNEYPGEGEVSYEIRVDGDSEVIPTRSSNSIPLRELHLQPGRRDVTVEVTARVKSEIGEHIISKKGHVLLTN